MIPFDAAPFKCFAVALALTVGAPGTEAAEETDSNASAPVAAAETPSAESEEAQRLMEGDDIRITFPGAPNFDNQHKIRADGKITLPLIGDVQAAGLATLELQKMLSERYAKELINPEVVVSVLASAFPVYVTGAVLNPGEVRCDRPITVFEVIMKAGGFDPVRAKLERVSIIPRNGKKRDINLRKVMEGKEPNNEFVSAFDTIVVPDKAIWF